MKNFKNYAHLFRLKFLSPLTCVLLISAIIVGTFFLGCKKEPMVYKIGCVTPLTGEGATYGAATKRGIDLAVEEINNAGGINGIKIKVIYEDDKMNPKDAVNALNKLIRVNKVPVIIGGFTSRVTLALAPIAEQNKVILFSSSSTADEIKFAGDYIFRNVPPNKSQGNCAALFVINFLKKKKAAILYKNDDYGKSLADAFKESFLNVGGQIVIEESYDPGKKDFRDLLTKIKSLNPPIIFYPGNYQESGIILKQAREMGIKSTFVGGDGSYSPELINIAGVAAEGSYYTLMAMGFGIADQEIENFTKNFKEKYGEEPDVYAAYAYDAMKTLAEAIRIGGYSADGVKKALYSTTFKGVTGITKFDNYGEVDKPYYIYEVKNGKFELLKWVPSR